MRKLYAVKLAVLASIAIVPLAQAQSSAACWRQAEIDAARMRNVQTVLMVSALECRTSAFAADRLYNDFVAQNRSNLQGHNDTLRAHFFRAFGEVEGRRAYDRFTTSLANRQSRESNDNSGFCRNAETLGRLAVASDPHGVLALASDLEERPYGVSASCDEAADRPRLTPAVLPDSTGPEAMAPESAGPEDAQPQDQADEERDAPAPAQVATSAPAPLSAEAVAPVAVPVPVALAAAAPLPTPAAAPVAAPLPAPVAIAMASPAPAALPVPSPTPVAVPAVAVAPPVAAPAALAKPVAARADPAAALAAAADALKAAAEAMREANAAPADAAPVIRERLPAAKKL